MFDILFARTFCIVGCMLLVTAGASFLNKWDKNFGWFWIIAVFVLLFMVQWFSSVFPLNLVLVWLFSAAMGWMISPTIKSIWVNSKMNTFLKQRWIKLDKNTSLSDDQLIELEEYMASSQSDDAWNRIVTQALLSTAIAVFATASLVFMTDIDFGFMWMFLFVALLILVVVSLLNVFIFKSKIVSLIKAYFWVLIFTGYLIFDFNRLEKMAWDDSWSAAIDIAMSLYLDIINIFLFILEILWEG